MAKPLQSASIAAPGFYGLNTQESSITLAAGFALQADNCVIDKYGRLGARKGWAYAAEQSGIDLKGAHEFIDINGNRYIGAWNDTSFYIINGSTITEVTYNGSSTITSDGWQAATLNDAAYLFKRGIEPIYFSPTDNVLDDVTNATNSATVTINNTSNVVIENTNSITASNTYAITLTHSGTVATAVQDGHLLSTGDTVIISGATETEYNGTFTITVVDDNSYTYTMSSSPSQDATGSPVANTKMALVSQTSHRLTDDDTVIISGANESEYNGTFTITTITDNFYFYEMSSVPSGDATGTLEANTKVAIVSHTGHGFSTGDEVKISGATEAGYNGTFTITVLGNNTYFYNMDSVPSQDATGTPKASTERVTVTHTGHRLPTGTEVVITGASPSEYNGTFEITVIDVNSYYYNIPSIPTSNASGTITATWDKGTPPYANTVLSAYGRLWAADTYDATLNPTGNSTTVYWSNLLDGTSWEQGTAGSIDLSSILVNGNDEIVALGAQAGRLIVFCKDNVIIFGDTDADKSLDPTNMKLVEVIHGVGCVARDSVQNTGTDILFLAKDGLRSLGRLIQEKSQPMRDLSKNVRDDIVRDLWGTDPTTIRSVYSSTEAFYLLLIPEYKRIYCFDMRSMLQDGSSRVTIWDNQTHSNMIEFYDEILGKDALYFTQADGIAKYTGYQDNGESYEIKYYTNYFDFGDSTKQKYLKRLGITLIGGSGQDIKLKAGYDYDDSYSSFPISIASQANAEYGEAEYGFEFDAADELSGVEWIVPSLPAYASHDYVLRNDLDGSYWNITDYLRTEDEDWNYKTNFWYDETVYLGVSLGSKKLSTIQEEPEWLRGTYHLNIPDYVFAEYTVGTLSDTIRAPLGGSGGVLQVGFEATINGSQLSIQKLDMYIKEGRVY